MVHADTRSARIASRDGAVVRFLGGDGAALDWPAIADRLAGDAGFRATWNAAWATDFDHLWKPVPLHAATRDAPFFAVLVPSRFPPADASAFRTHLDALPPGEPVASFANLGGDAHLVVPAERGAYGHLAAFCRTAPPQEADAFWTEVGRQCRRALADGAAVWCNTHGHGVPWLHVRFDATHKYAAFPPRGPITPASQAVWYRDHYAPVFSA